MTSSLAGVAPLRSVLERARTRREGEESKQSHDGARLSRTGKGSGVEEPGEVDASVGESRERTLAREHSGGRLRSRGRSYPATRRGARRNYHGTPTLLARGTAPSPCRCDVAGLLGRRLRCRRAGLLSRGRQHATQPAVPSASHRPGSFAGLRGARRCSRVDLRRGERLGGEL